MRAWLIDDLTGIGSLRLAEIPDPVPHEGEVILRVHYASLNPADRYLAEGQYPAKPPFPHVLGRDGMGTVEQVGPGVTLLRPGDRRAVLRSEVGVNRPGTFAERVAVPVDNLVEIPAGWSDPEVAGATLVYLTAYQALTMWGALPQDSLVLVTGASGGVGVAAVQLARAIGHRVVALSRSEGKSRRLRELGATNTFDPEDPDWRRSAKAAIAPCRVDLAIDNVGGKLLPEVDRSARQSRQGQRGRTSRRTGAGVQHRNPVLPPHSHGRRRGRRLDQRGEPRSMGRSPEVAIERQHPTASRFQFPLRGSPEGVRAPGPWPDGKSSSQGGHATAVAPRDRNLARAGALGASARGGVSAKRRMN